MKCTNPITLFKNVDPAKYPAGLTVPCGKCLACRIQKRKEWSMRVLHELDAHDNAVFVTLTYNDDNLPEYSSLRKDDVQRFFKRLRKELSLNGRKIRHFTCGEYGDETERPHYHSIIFGMSLCDTDKHLITWKWGLGHVHFGLAEPDSIQYVAQYIDKKYSGPLAVTEYDDRNREPVFKLSSLGIGKNYVKNNELQIKQMLCVPYRGVKQSLPRYYLNNTDINPEEVKQKAIDNECELVERLTGLYCTREQFYLTQAVKDIVELESKIRASKNQTDRNLQTRSNLKSRKKI